MKKFYLVFAVVVLAVAFVSCQKEGQFKPKSQISRVMYSSPSTNKYMIESWNWDDKKLSKIDHYYTDGTIYWTEYFTYDDKNRISKVEDFKYNETVEYKYDGKNLKSVDYYDDGRLEQTVNITYDGKKISRLEFVNYDVNKNTKNTEAKHMGFLFDAYESTAVEHFEKAVSSKAINITNETRTIDVVWDGDNIVNTSYNFTRSGVYTESEVSYPVSYSYNVESVYTYDKNVNPKYGLRNLYCIVGSYGDNETTMACFSKNNVTSISDRWSEKYMINGQLDPDSSESGIDDYNYTYTYDKNIPTEVLYTHRSDGYTYTHTTYYEYK